MEDRSVSSASNEDILPCPVQEEDREPLLRSQDNTRRATMLHRKPLVDVLAALFGVGAWVAVNGLWVELPLLVTDLPEGWNLPSYLSVIIQIANIGPIAYSLLSAFRPSLRPASVIYGVLVIGCLSSLLLCVLWQETTWVGGAEHSTALLALVFLLSLVDCTSSVLYMPYMAVWRGIYLPSYLVGEGLSGLLPALVALAQGVGGNSECINVTNPDNTTSLQPAPLQPLFSVTDFFFILFGMMVASALAFILLEKLPSIRSERTSLPGPTYGESAMEASRSNTQLVGRETTPSPKAEPHCMSKRMYAVMLLGQGWACMLTNGVLPSIQSYSCGAYGNVAYHLAASLSALANPSAALLTLVLPRARSWILGLLGTLGSLVAAYILATAALSPQPPLMGTTAGEALVVLAWVVFTFIMTYVRVEIANLMREQGARALFWCGAVTQAGSAVGAVTTFVLVNVYNLFTPYYPCS
ncbi:solute carrier family 52, riboflavin transporter, member 3-B isoform X2 [Penaeus vannamei]